MNAINLTLALFYAAFVQKATDFLRNSFDVHNKVPKPYWQIVSFGFGMLAAFAFKVDVFATLSGTTGKLVSGFVLGAGASFLHDISDGGTPAPTPKGLLPSGYTLTRSKPTTP